MIQLLEMDKLIIGQWNCRSAISNKANLEHLLISQNITIALISETWFKTQKYINFPGYNITRCDRPDGKGGAAILIKSNLVYKDLNTPILGAGVQIVGIGLKINNSLSLSLISLYIKPNTRITTNQWVTFFNAIPRPFIVGGDFNAHSLAWGCGFNDVAGNNLLEALHQNNLIFLNNGKPTFIGKFNTRDTAIDVTIATPDIANSLQWDTYLDPCGSDHLPIIVNCNLSPQCAVKSLNKKWNLKKANWEGFVNDSESILSEESSNNYGKFMDELNLIIARNIPKYNEEGTNTKAKSWWNDLCQTAVNKRKNDYKTYRNNPSLLNLLKYKKSDAQAKQIIKKEKRKSWREYCSSLSKNSNLKEVWNKVNRYKNRKQNNIVPIDMNNCEWINDLHQKIAPCWVEISEPQRQIPRTLHNAYLSRPFSILELERALKSNNNTAPGRDNVHYSMISNISANAKKILINLFNNIWKNNIDIPEDWNNYNIIPILKPGKPTNVAESYRPISLASCVLKTYERIVKNRIEHWLEMNNKIPKGQFGFRKGCSTQESLADFVTEVQLTFTKNHSIAAAFLDIKGAYDNVNLTILAKKMMKIGIPTNIVYSIMKLYNKRNTYIKIQDKYYGPRITNQGLPQGSILSPLLYLIYAADFEKIFDQNIRVLQFADDICILSSGNSIERSLENLGGAIAEVRLWTRQNGLEISENKSVIVNFTRKRFTPTSEYINLGGYRFLHKTSTKFLGIILDQKLNWKEHINYTIKRAENAINILKTFCGHSWGADPNMGLLFYKSLIRSILDYGSIFYGSATKTHLRKIEMIKNKCIRICLGCLPSTPIVAMEAEAGEAPLEKRREYLTNKFIIKLHAKNSPLLNKIGELTTLCLTHRYWGVKKTPLHIEAFIYVSDFCREIYTSSKLPNFLIPYQHFLFKIETDSISDFRNFPESTINYHFKSEVNRRWPHHEILYTDGSKINNKVGYAVFYPKKNIIVKQQLSGYTSNFTAELKAIKEAFKICLENNTQHHIIFTDCLSALQKIKSASPVTEINYLVAEIVRLNYEIISQGKTITLIWIKAHVGIKENETVDKLAKEAALIGAVDITFKTPKTDFYTTIKDKMRQDWQKHYESATSGVYFRNIKPEISKKPWFRDIHNKKFIQTIVRLRTNHIICPKYKHKIGQLDDPNCNICIELADPQHILLQCSLNTNNINQFITQINNSKIPSPFNLANLLTYEKVFKIIYNHYCKSKDLFG